LDPDAGPVQRFAHELRLLRREVGNPLYRVMAQRADVTVTTLSRAAAGERLPTVDDRKGECSLLSTLNL
jgi:hypothetical protein